MPKVATLPLTIMHKTLDAELGDLHPAPPAAAGRSSEFPPLPATTPKYLFADEDPKGIHVSRQRQPLKDLAAVAVAWFPINCVGGVAISEDRLRSDR